MEKIKYVHRQDCGFKLSAGNSGETSLNLSNEIFDLIAKGTMQLGEEKEVSFKIYKEDCIKAICFIILKLPLYQSSSTSSIKITDSTFTFRSLTDNVNAFFGQQESVNYKVNLNYRNDGRIYLNHLRVNNFSIRDMLVENHSALQFQEEEDGTLSIRILSNIEEKDNIEDSNPLSAKEVLRNKAAATFLRRALRITKGKDSSFTNLAKLNKYEKSSKQLKINGFPLGRDKDQLPTRIDDVDMDIEWYYDNTKYVLYLEWTPEMMEKLFFPVYNEAYHGFFHMAKDSNGEYVLYEFSVDLRTDSLQQIFYGAPGTSKSHTINETTTKIEVDTELNGEEPRVFRTTFHPDSDYSTFVGCYKPCMRSIPQTYIVEGEEKPVKGADGKQVNKDEIVYSFIPQSFTKAYIRAWQTDKPVYLVIEEINRGNCAQIFGDLFQLLDRKNNVSEYPIQPDADLGNYLKEQLENKHREGTPKEIFQGEKLCLPSNLYIWASMNTSDQSLFPIDSAFKRRWDWRYMKITNMDEKVDNPYRIIVKDNQYQWWAFVDKMNNHIGSSTSSEDKKLGYFFIHREDGIISADDFVSKVLFYLYNDALKDYSVPLKVKKGDELKTASFSDFYDEKGNIIADKVIEALDDFLKVNKKEPVEDQQ